MSSAKKEAEMHKMDETDGRILADLRAHGRDSYRQVARRLSLHPATVIKRAQAMQKNGLIKGFGAQVDFLRLGYEFMAMVEIRCTSGRIPEVGAKLAAQRSVVSVWDITGHEDMMILVACKTRAEFNRAIKSIGALAHVERTITHFILNVIKSEGDFEL